MSGAVVIAPPTASRLSTRKCAEQAEQVGARQRANGRSRVIASRARRSRPRASRGRRSPRPAASAARRSSTKVRTANAPASGRPSRLLPQRRHQLEGGGDDQPGGHRAHAAQRAGDDRRGCENSAYAAVSARTITSGTSSMPATRGERAAQAEVAVAEHQREVDDVRPGQHLAQRQHLDELLARQPALALDQLALGDRAARRRSPAARAG